MSKKRTLNPRQSSLLSEEEKKYENPPPRTSSAPSQEAYQRFQRENTGLGQSPIPPRPSSPVNSTPVSPRMTKSPMPKKDTLSADTPSPKSKSIQSILKNLEQKSKTELLNIAKKMVSEINVKNKIISEVKQNEKWMMAELALSRDKSRPQKNSTVEIQNKFQNAVISSEDKDFLQTLMAFKVELAAAKKTVEEHEVSLIIMEKKRITAEEQVAYLKAISNPNNPNLDATQTQRIRELEGQLEETIQDFTVLQTKVSQWARTSKRNQEGRISAEAIQKVLEEENAELKIKLGAANSSEAALRSQLASYAESLKESGNDKDEQFLSMLSASQMQIADLEKQLLESKSVLEISDLAYEKEVGRLQADKNTLTEKVETLRRRNRELEEIVGSKNEYQDIIKKRASTQLISPAKIANFNSVSSPSSTTHSSSILKSLAKSANAGNATSPNNAGSVPERELRFLQEKVSDLEDEVGRLVQTERTLRLELAESDKQYQKLQQNINDQEDLLASLAQAQADNSTLQSAYDAALDKIRQKQLSIEMLQKNMDKARDKLEPYQKSMEELDDLQDKIAEERLEAQEYKERIVELELDCAAKQSKILSLMERLEDHDLEQPAGSNAFQDMQERIDEYRNMNETLSSQLEDRTRELKLLESRLVENSKQLKSTDILPPEGFSLSNSNRNQTIFDDEDDEPALDYKKEFKNATAILAEQLITIKNLENVIADDNQMVESLTMEKKKLSQKLSLMQRIKAEYDNQTAEYEKLLTKNKELEDMAARYSEDNESMIKLKEQLSTQNKVVARLQEALESMTKENSDMIDSNNLNEQLQELRQQVNVLKDENARLNQLELSLAEADAESALLQQKLNQKIQQIIILENNIGDMEKDHAKEILIIKDSLLIEKENEYAKKKDTPVPDNQDELARLVSKLDAAERELEVLRMKDGDFEDGKVSPEDYQKHQHLEEIESKTEEIAWLQKELEKLEDKLPFYDANSSSQSRRASANGLSRDELRQELKERDREIEELVLKLDQAEAHISKLEAATVELHANTDLKIKLRDLEEEHTQLLKNMKNMVESHDIELEAVRSSISRAISLETDQLQAKITGLEHELESLQRQNLEFTRETTLSQRLLEEKAVEINRLQLAIDSLNTQYRELEISSKEIIERHDSSRVEIEKKYEDSLRQKGEEMEKLKITIHEAEGRIKDFELSLQEDLVHSRIKELEDTLTLKDAEFQSFKDQLEGQLKSGAQKIVELNATHEQEVYRLTAELKIFQDKNHELAEKCADLEFALTGLREQLEHHSAIAEDAMRQIDEYEDEILALRENSGKEDQVELLKSRLAASEKELFLMKSKLANTSVESTDERIVELQAMNEQLMDKIASLTEKITIADNNRMSINPLFHQDSQRELERCNAQLKEAIEKINNFHIEKSDLYDEIDDLRDHNIVLQKALNEFKNS